MDLDGTEIYDINTGKTISEIDAAEESQIQELLREGEKDDRC